MASKYFRNFVQRIYPQFYPQNTHPIGQPFGLFEGISPPTTRLFLIGAFQKTMWQIYSVRQIRLPLSSAIRVTKVAYPPGTDQTRFLMGGVICLVVDANAIVRLAIFE